MDILTHALSGVLAATGIAAFSRTRLRQKAGTVCCGAMGGVLPDIDAITMWPNFDATIGERFNLTVSGRAIYFGDYAYSHHNFTHSLAAGLMATLLAGALIYGWRLLRAKGVKHGTAPKQHAGYLLALFAGYAMHLLGDLPTPGHTWQGIKLLWPLDRPMGGTGHIWWWNNYDIFLLLLAGSLANLVLIPFSRKRHRKAMSCLAVLVMAATLSAAAYQATHRPVRFGGPRHKASHATNERRSLEVQRKILGNSIFDTMVSFDRRLKIYF